MKTADLQIGHDYAMQTSQYSGAQRVRVLETGVEYKSVDHSLRVYRQKTRTGGVLVAYADAEGKVMTNKGERTHWIKGKAFEPGQTLTRVVRPQYILHSWDAELERQEMERARQATAQTRRETREADLDRAIEIANARLPEDLQLDHFDRVYHQSLGYTHIKLTASQLEALLS